MAKAIAIVLVMMATIETTKGIRNKQMTSNVTQTLDSLLASNRYDKRLRPGFGDSPITISVNFFIKSMGPVSDNDQSFGLDCYFRQHWYDLRLQYQKLPGGIYKSGLEEFSMSWLFLDRVWKPDTYFVNGKRSFLHRITVPNKFLRLRHDGYITYSMRLTITASCPMYLRKFPLDAQRCPLILGSYGYTDKDLVYAWTDERPIGLQQGVEIAQFDLVNITTENAKVLVKGGLPYSTLQADFWLKRHTGYFMLQVYIPCGLIVVCSWISFWIDPDAVPARVYVPCGLIVLSSWVSFWIDPDDVAARVALGVTTVLSLTTMGFGGRSQLPKVSYWTALDWFVIICFTSVFSVMIEYAIVNFMDKLSKDFKALIQSRKKEEQDESKERKAQGKRLKEMAKSSSLKEKVSEKRPRSASFSFTQSKSKENEAEAEEKNYTRIKTQAQIEIEPSGTLLHSLKNLPRRLSTRIVAHFESFEPKQRSQSIPNITLSVEDTEEVPEIMIASEDLIDFETEVEPCELVLNVGEEGRIEWETMEVQEEKKRSFMSFLKPSREFWKKLKILPLKRNLVSPVDGSESPNKFSKIDVQSRRNFPIAFLLSLSVYLFAFSYYLTDDFPARDSSLILYRQ